MSSRTPDFIMEMHIVCTLLSHAIYNALYDGEANPRQLI